MWINCNQYLHQRWLANSDVEPKELWAEYMALYGHVSPTSFPTVWRRLKEFKAGNFASLDKGISFQAVELVDNLLPEKGNIKEEDEASKVHIKIEDEEDAESVLMERRNLVEMEMILGEEEDSSARDSASAQVARLPKTIKVEESEDAESVLRERGNLVDMERILREEEDSNARESASALVARLPKTIQRAFILQHYMAKIPLDDAVAYLQTNYGVNTYSSQMVSYWYSRFKDGDYSCEDVKRSGRNKSVHDSELIRIIKEEPSSD